jgi:diguanylate cyclase (GGDEF)-like protein
MVLEDTLSAVLSEFARTLVTDFPIQGILDRLTERIVDVLPVTGAGVTLISAGEAPRYIAASDATALRFEELQTSLGEGPCVAAYNSGSGVAIPDLRIDRRFTGFREAGLAAGLAAVFSFPMVHAGGRIGALDLYRDTSGALTERELATAQTLADVAAAYLINAQARDEARAVSEGFHHSSLHDALTGLPNRLLLKERLEHASQRALRSHSSAAVLFADLDRFKDVNDTYGHQVGDELLLAVADRLSRLVRPGDSLARVSGDEFVFLVEDLDGAADAGVLARRIEQAFEQPFVLTGVQLTITASVGIAFAGPGEDISDQLVARADMAMYQAKRRGGGHHQLIDLRQLVRSQSDDDLREDLRAALEHDQLAVAYQPIVRMSDGLVTGVEALLRWTHPGRGRISAHWMVAAAEQTGLIHEIGAWVLQRSCRDRGRWLAAHPDAPLDLAVNVSTRQLKSRDFAAGVAAALATTGMEPSALTLEMTENILIEDSERAMAVLTDLKRMGVRLALDDFGTGFSSLNYLRCLPVDIVKIDQAFIADIDQADAGGAIVTAVTDLAHVLGLTVTAEGVESRSQRDVVKSIGCESAQGYFYSRPMDASAVDRLLASGVQRTLRLPASMQPAGTGADEVASA